MMFRWELGGLWFINFALADNPQNFKLIVNADFLQMCNFSLDQGVPELGGFRVLELSIFLEKDADLEDDFV